MCLLRHGKFKCTSKRICGMDNCKFQHHQLLHNDNHTVQANIPELSNYNTHQQSKNSVLYRIVPVMLHSRKATATDLGLLGPAENLCLK